MGKFCSIMSESVTLKEFLFIKKSLGKIERLATRLAGSEKAVRDTHIDAATKIVFRRTKEVIG